MELVTSPKQLIVEPGQPVAFTCIVTGIDDSQHIRWWKVHEAEKDDHNLVSVYYTKHYLLAIFWPLDECCSSNKGRGYNSSATILVVSAIC